MTLADDMETDITDVFLDTDEHAQSCTCKAAGAGDGFALVVFPLSYDLQIEPEPMVPGTRELRSERFLARLSDLTVTGALAREPLRGDTLTFGSDSHYAGEWHVSEPPEPDGTGGVVLPCTQPQTLEEAV